MRVVHDPEGLADFPRAALVPTMGALHEGHLSLVRAAATRAGRGPVVVSVFVNPTQFGPGEDFDRYPRSLERDVEAAGGAGADVVFAPAADLVYPPDVEVPVPGLPEVAVTPGLEDHCRPGHLAGVCQVVARLFDLVGPAAAVFGEKDYQQLLVIEAMVEQARPRWGDLTIVRHATVREADGLALSSRNAYLDRADRARALGLRRALDRAMTATDPETAEGRMLDELARHDLDVEYAVVRDAASLLPVASLARPARALMAAKVGPVRLIDNDALPVRADPRIA